MSILGNIGDFLKEAIGINTQDQLLDPNTGKPVMTAAPSVGAKLAQTLAQGASKANELLSGLSQPYSSTDVATAQETPPDDGGFFNTIRRMSISGAKNRIAREAGEREDIARTRAEEDRQLQQRKTQAEIGALGGLTKQREAAAKYSEARSAIETKKNELRALEIQMKGAKDKGELEALKMRAEAALQTAQAALQNASTNAQKAEDAAERNEMDNEVKQRALDLQEARDLVDKAYKEGLVRVAGARADTEATRTGHYGRAVDAQNKIADSLTTTEAETEEPAISITPVGGSTFTLPVSEGGQLEKMFKLLPELKEQLTKKQGGFLGIGGTPPEVKTTTMKKKSTKKTTKQSGATQKPRIVIKSVE